MNKKLLTLLCLLTLSVFAGTSFASNDATEILNNDSIQISENTNMDISISEDTEISENTKKEISHSQSNQTNQETTSFDDLNKSFTPNNNDLKPIESSFGSSFFDDLFGFSKYQKKVLNNTDSNNSSNITGPKINGPKLDIKGPKLDPKYIELMKLKATLQKYKNQNLTIEIVGDGDGRKLVVYAMSSAAPCAVCEAGDDLIKLLEEEGVISDMGLAFKGLMIEICCFFDWDWPFGDFFDS